MIISHRKRFIMFLPWKTASQTIAARLEHLNESPYSRFFHFNPYLQRVVHQHMTCADFLSLPESRLGYFTGSFVRNPYDRAFSGFRQLQKDLIEQPTFKFPSKWVRDLVMKQLAENKIRLLRAKGDFDRWLDLVDDYQIYEQGRNTNFPLHPAHYWTHIAGQQVVDFVGKVENFDNDIAQFARLINIGELPQVNANVVELEARASADDSNYRYIDRMSTASIRKINRLFASDFEIFGYTKI